MKSTIKVLIVQTDIVWESPESNFRNVEELTRRVDFSSIDLMLLPEMFSTGFTMSPETVGSKAYPATLEWMKTFAKSKSVSVLGSTIEVEGSRFHNTAFLVDERGEVKGSYRKIHLFGQEKEHYIAGDELLMFPLGPFTATVFICYDLRFPEIFRAALSKGADLFFLIANWPSVRHRHWTNMVTTRAIENQSYLCVCNRTGNDPALTYQGGSGLIRPDGSWYESSPGETPGVATVELDMAHVEQFRSSIPCLKDRRVDLYGGL